jgi:phosphatidate phosphatase APP1
MSDLKHILLKGLTEIESRYDEAKFKLQQRLGLGQLQIIPFLGYGTKDEMVVRGRVLRDKGIHEPMDTASLLTNVLDMYKRYQSDEIPGATVQATYNGQTYTTMTNDEGFFTFQLRPQLVREPQETTALIDLELVSYPGKEQNPVEPTTFKAQAQVIMPPSTAQFGVISDIDDTVMRTDVANILSMARNTFFENSRTRLPFEGVSKFFQALRRGVSGDNFNPIFYVSSSTWNLYDMLYDFFVVREIPLGAMFLSEYNINEDTFIVEGHHEHKIEAIETVLKAYPDLPFVLIGDSTQQDAAIYYEIVQKYAGRILTVYIRDATTDAIRDQRVQEIAKQVEALGVPMLLIPDSYYAAEHATKIGLIHPDALPTIREERNEDQEAPTPLEQALNVEPGTIQKDG